MRPRSSISEPESVLGSFHLPSPVFPPCFPQLPCLQAQDSCHPLCISNFVTISHRKIKLSPLIPHLNPCSINFPSYSSSYGAQSLTLRGDEQNSTTDNRVALTETVTRRLNRVKDELYSFCS